MVPMIFKLQKGCIFNYGHDDSARGGEELLLSKSISASGIGSYITVYNVYQLFYSVKINNRLVSFFAL
jgi:hypothetical protein